MRVRGLDFSSAKDRPFLPVVEGYGEGNRLDIDEITIFRSHEELFAAPKRRPNDKVVVTGYDFPFGQSVELADRFGMPKVWRAFVDRLPKSADEWRDTLKAMRAKHPDGSKECPRQTDRDNKAQAATKTDNPPVGMMYWYGVKLLIDHEEPIYPVVPGSRERGGVYEAYPTVVKRPLGPKPTVNAVLDLLPTRGIVVGPNILSAIEENPKQAMDIVDSVICAYQAWDFHRSNPVWPTEMPTIFEGEIAVRR